MALRCVYSPLHPWFSPSESLWRPCGRERMDGKSEGGCNSPVVLCPRRHILSVSYKGSVITFCYRKQKLAFLTGQLKMVVHPCFRPFWYLMKTPPSSTGIRVQRWNRKCGLKVESVRAEFVLCCWLTKQWGWWDRKRETLTEQDSMPHKTEIQPVRQTERKRQTARRTTQNERLTWYEGAKSGPQKIKI